MNTRAFVLAATALVVPSAWAQVNAHPHFGTAVRPSAAAFDPQGLDLNGDFDASVSTPAGSVNRFGPLNLNLDLGHDAAGFNLQLAQDSRLQIGGATARSGASVSLVSTPSRYSFDATIDLLAEVTQGGQATGEFSTRMEFRFEVPDADADQRFAVLFDAAAMHANSTAFRVDMWLDGAAGTPRLLLTDRGPDRLSIGFEDALAPGGYELVVEASGRTDPARQGFPPSVLAGLELGASVRAIGPVPAPGGASAILVVGLAVARRRR